MITSNEDSVETGTATPANEASDFAKHSIETDTGFPEVEIDLKETWGEGQYLFHSGADYFFWYSYKKKYVRITHLTDYDTLMKQIMKNVEEVEGTPLHQYQPTYVREECFYLTRMG